MNRKNKENRIYYIYKTTNLTTGKIYVGQRSTNKEIEFDYYLGSGVTLKRSIKKYGHDNFKKEILEICNLENVDEREIYWIKKLDARNSEIGYNISIGGDGQGSGEDHPFYGCHHTKDARNRIGKANKLYIQKDEQKRRNSESNKGRIITKKQRQQISETLTNKYKKEDHPNFGSKRSKETKLKIRNSRLGKKASEETKLKIKQTTVFNKSFNCSYCDKLIKGGHGNLIRHESVCVKNKNRITTGIHPKTTCPYCGKIGGKNVMYRFHFDNCKYKPIGESTNYAGNNLLTNE